MQYNFPKGRLTLDQIEPFIEVHSNQVFGKFRNLQLNSAFQPIFSLAHRRPVGFEALLRPLASDGSPMSPLAVFDMPEDEPEMVFLDRLCRIIHIRNFMAQGDENNWLFLNINPIVTVYGRQYGSFFADVLKRYKISPHRLVIEILEGQIQNESLLSEAVMYFKELGCLVAIDDFGAGHSNFDRIWRIQPHIVKLDRSIITQAGVNPSVRRVIPNLVNLIHEAGSLALMEGVENEEEALISIDSDIDFVQGYYFARPEKKLPAANQHRSLIDHLSNISNLNIKNESVTYNNKLHAYQNAFQISMQQLMAGEDANSACQKFLALQGTERCYFLNSEGMQLGNNISLVSSSNYDPRFKPMNDSKDAVWVRRHYFRRAMNSPETIQTSRPYLSITGGNMCVTLSVALIIDKEMIVFCGDLIWND
jgi:EAL domain-containing protein (putative c-di-GMP-specific phosphodiesterase class I)